MSKTHPVNKKAVVVSRPARPALKSKGAKKRTSTPPVASAPKINIPKKYRRIYEVLIHQRERLAKQISFLATDNLTRTQDDVEVDFRSKEQGTDNFDREFALNCVSRNQDMIFEVDQALNRIHIGTFGKCESCGHAIEEARLESLPYSRMCIACKSKTETGSRDNRVARTGLLSSNNDKSLAEVGDDDE